MIVRRLTLATVVAFSTMAAGLALSGTVALAAAPEAPGPVTVQLPVGATKATVHGVLSPKAEGHPGTYEFLYKKGSLSCQGEGNAPASPGMMLGFEAEEVTETLTGLQAHMEYAVCLLARNPKGETAVGPAVTFTTALALEAPTTTALPAGVTALTATTATLHGVLNPLAKGEAGSYEFAYRQSASECQRENPETGQRENEKATPTEPAVGNAGEAVQATAAELLPNTRYTFCLLARNEAGETALGAPVTFTTSTEAPMITGETFSHVTPTGATVTAEVNTENLPGEYYYLYGTESEFEAKAAHKTPEVNLPASSVPVPAPAHLTGLQPDTEYHFVLVATNADSGINLGEILSFTTLPESAPGLPDDRTYEMVTPAENDDADVYVPVGLPSILVNNAGEFETKLPFQVATDGEAVTYAASPTVGGTGNSGLSEGNEYLSRRLAGGGWGAPVNIQPAGVKSAFYQAFSPDLRDGILESGEAGEPEAPGLSPVAPGGGYSVLYEHALEGGDYAPFFTSKPPNRAAGEFQTHEVPKIYPTASHELAFGGASAGFERLLFEANDAFAGTAAVDGGAAENNLYESVGGRLSLVSVLPDGSTEANATFGAPPLSRPAKNPPDFENVVSADGSRVFWTDLNPGKENLYVSEGVGSGSERTVQVDASQVPGGRGGGGRYWTASKDGSRVFFTDSDAADLTSDTRAGSGENLYVYEVATGNLTDLTVAAGAEVEGVLGEGETEAGQYTVYFAAKGVLAGNANSNGVKAEAGADNLYKLGEGEQPIFIAALTNEDGIEADKPLALMEGGVGDWVPALGRRTAEVTADGRGLVFMSNNQEFEGHFEKAGSVRLQEVYVYEAQGDGLFCASCSRDGIKPVETRESEFGLGAFLPVSHSNTALMSGLISSDGSRVFFDGDEPLVPGDTNGEQDVYEWERDGAGGCAVSSGCIYLLSGGVGDTTSWLVGASETGSDVFMVTRAQLVPGDGNEAYDLYDARVGGVSPVAPPSCSGTGCQGLPSAPPVFATPPSVTFSGVGNFPPPAPEAVSKPKPKVKPRVVRCKRSQIRRGTRCVHKPPAKAKKSNLDRRAGR